MRKVGPKLLLLLISLLFTYILFIRFYRAVDFFSFNFDEEYQAWLAWMQVVDFHFIWIGVGASGLKYYLGPGFVYLNALLFKLSGGDPVILAYFSPLVGVATLVSIFFVVKTFLGKRAGVFAAIMYGGSAYINYFDRRFWNPLPIPILTVWLVFSLLKAKTNPKWMILAIGLMALSYHVHLSLWIFWPILAWQLLSIRKNLKPVTIVAMVMVFLGITSPLLVFDFVHNFDNILAPFKFILNIGGLSHTPLYMLFWQHLQSLWNVLGKVWVLNWYSNLQEEQYLGAHVNLATIASPILNLLSLLILLSVFYKYLNKPLVRLIALAMGIYFVAYVFYPGEVLEHFLLGFIGLEAVVIGIFVSRLPTGLGVLITFLFLFVNTGTVLTSNQAKYGLTARRNLINKTMQALDNSNFDLKIVGNDPRIYSPYGGWRYLFQSYGKLPTTSEADESFGWIYGIKPAPSKPTYGVVIAEARRLSTKFTPKVQFQDGAFSAYIFPSGSL